MDCLLDEDILGRHDLVVLALVVSEKNLHGQAVLAAGSLWIAEDLEVDVLPAEDLEPRVVIAVVHTVTHLAPLHAWLDVLVCAAFYVCVGIRFLVILLHFCR